MLQETITVILAVAGLVAAARGPLGRPRGLSIGHDRPGGAAKHAEKVDRRGLLRDLMPVGVYPEFHDRRDELSRRPKAWDFNPPRKRH